METLRKTIKADPASHVPFVLSFFPSAAEPGPGARADRFSLVAGRRWPPRVPQQPRHDHQSQGKQHPHTRQNFLHSPPPVCGPHPLSPQQLRVSIGELDSDLFARVQGRMCMFEHVRYVLLADRSPGRWTRPTLSAPNAALTTPFPWRHPPPSPSLWKVSLAAVADWIPAVTTFREFVSDSKNRG